ncbi:PilZ domain-containing protein [Bradyrhizobium sp. Tv2a-2]|uniref:PilZ domain-containing protein n=1 Tax=Bradyrhizobium sp. Tv2a-2 TaxID=113395 RepID=UPI000418008C|nr:PilZ domain-containing protein [Bradyrhizobium sp. Tv2a-2]
MQDRRANARDKVLFGGRAAVDARSSMNCVVRNLSENGACVEVDGDARVPQEINLTIARKGRSYLAQVVWREANRLGLAFRAMITDPGSSDLDARLRASEKKKRELQRRIKQLIGEG